MMRPRGSGCSATNGAAFLDDEGQPAPLVEAKAVFGEWRFIVRKPHRVLSAVRHRARGFVSDREDFTAGPTVGPVNGE
jgi:hypothetical protein